MRLVSAVLIFLAAASVQAAPPGQIHLQGALTNPGGGPAPDGAYGLSVRLFTAEEGGALLHEEPFGAADSAIVKNGVFSVRLGSVKALDPALFVDNETIWVEVQVEIEDPLPRRSMASAPWALAANWAKVAQSLEGPAPDLDCSGCVQKSELGFSVVTTSDLNAALATLYTKAEIDTAIETAATALAATVYTKAATDAAITAGVNALGQQVYTKADMDTQLGGYLPLTGGALTGPLSVAGSVRLAGDAVECNAENAGKVRYVDGVFEGCTAEYWVPFNSPAPEGPFVFSAASGTDVGTSGSGIKLGTIAGVPGKSIHVTRLGICGDSDESSGPNRFKLAPLGTTFAAGKSDPGSTFFLGATAPSTAGGHGFVYTPVSLLAPAGVSVDIMFEYHNDWDGHYCVATDEFGNNYADGSSSVRAWVKYEYK